MAIYLSHNHHPHFHDLSPFPFTLLPVMRGEGRLIHPLSHTRSIIVIVSLPVFPPSPNDDQSHSDISYAKPAMTTLHASSSDFPGRPSIFAFMIFPIRRQNSDYRTTSSKTTFSVPLRGSHDECVPVVTYPEPRPKLRTPVRAEIVDTTIFIN